MRLLLIILIAGGASFLLGATASTLAALMPCHGEGLVCNIDAAVGGYSVLLWAPLSAAIFGVILLVSSNRSALIGGTILLLAPILVFFTLGTIESWSTAGVDAYGVLRKLLVMVMPPAVTVLTQTLILLTQLTPTDRHGAVAESPAP